VLWRCAIVVNVGWASLRSVKAGNLLPLLIFACGFLPMLTGQFGQPTTLGFAVFAIGLSLAAQKMDVLDSSSDTGDVPPSAPPVRRIPRRSEYASRLHGAPAAQRETNGANHH
jgi:hypothetical protein